MGHDGYRLSPLFTWRSAICDSELDSSTRLVAFVMSLHMKERGDSCFPSVGLVAQESGLSKRTVRRHLKVLVEEGWLAHVGWKKWQTPGGEQSTKVYRATIPEGVTECQYLRKGGDTHVQGGDTSGQKGVTPMSPKDVVEDDRGRSGSRPSRRDGGKPAGPGDPTRPTAHDVKCEDCGTEWRDDLHAECPYCERQRKKDAA